MLKIENVEVVGWDAAVRGIRNPANSWENADSRIGFGNVACPDCFFKDKNPCGQQCLELGYRDHRLMMNMAANPIGKRFRELIIVTADIIAPIYWWEDFQHIAPGVDPTSSSLYGAALSKEFSPEDFSCENLSDFGKQIIFDQIISALNYYRAEYLRTGREYDWQQVVGLLPVSYNQRRTVRLNYDILADIYQAWKDHTRSEWHEFCEWIVDLPYSEIITSMSESQKILRLGGKFREGFIKGVENPDPDISNAFRKWATEMGERYFGEDKSEKED